MSRTTDKVERLADLIRRDHGGCEDTTCTIATALEHGLALVAFESWGSSGASCADFDRLYASLPKSYRMGGREYEAERLEFCKIPAVECRCGAYVYNPDDCGRYCSSCGKVVAA